ncbi:peptidoglycan DD-metalloendopeptidase family protein [Nesterenkonia sandarakina]|uniref:Uncharacterized membrane protein YgaE (UPF0421/DUF939 family) n=1 Tax=Nesterenkonia sandarakina TaxID=272918 RepID=A0A2T0YKN2_9MICC|nr:peptidoglycan DD-metalloendopeptidase family protein [Nesterenkonia sandarakina]PRZ15683.1 uncharacterized membrane protein YgaE (UPF0421/DUF939 family) [Nesterenkonia sandarakina]
MEPGSWGFGRLRAAALGLALLLVVGVLTPASAGPAPPEVHSMALDSPAPTRALWQPPVVAEELRPFARPPSLWGAGHRGVDLGPLGDASSIRAPADGEVSFVGVVVDRPVLSIRHGDGYLSSFEPVESSLEVGDRVSAGDPVGTLAQGTGHCATPCLHWGVRLYGEYINPLTLTGEVEPSVLLPLETGAGPVPIRGGSPNPGTSRILPPMTAPDRTRPRGARVARRSAQQRTNRSQHDPGNGSGRRSTSAPSTRRVRTLVQRPEFLTDVLQILKTVIAGTGAWWVSTSVLESELAFLAPWTALLTVHATVHRSLSRGIQTTIASSLGVGLSFLIGYFLGVSLWTFALALLVGVVAARISWIRDEGIAIATTAIFVLGSGFDDQTGLLDDRIIEVAVGVAAGLLVNLLIVPPLRDKQASRYVDSINERMGSVLVNISQEFSDSWDTDQAEAWFQETESMTRELNSAWTVVRFARESRRANPRARQGMQSLRASSWNSEEASYEEILERVDEGISHLRHLTRTLREATYVEGEWNESFREQWAQIVGDAGRAIADPDADVASMHENLSALSREMAEDTGLPGTSWPLYGSLISSVRHIVVVVDDVASARQAREATSENPATGSE